MDSLVWDGDTCMGTKMKGGKTEWGELWAITGHLTAFRPWQDYLSKPPNERKDDPEVMKETTCILISPDGKVQMWSSDGWDECEAPFYSFGTGQGFALGAMQMGATAKQAVEAASVFDAYTGGGINVFELDHEPYSEPMEGETVSEMDLMSFANPPTDRMVAETWREKMGL